MYNKNKIRKIRKINVPSKDARKGQRGTWVPFPLNRKTIHVGLKRAAGKRKSRILWFRHRNCLGRKHQVGRFQQECALVRAGFKPLIVYSQVAIAQKLK